MELNFDIEIEPYIIEIIDNIDYYNYIRFRNFSIGIFLTKELRKVKGIVEANPHIGKKVQTNKYKYVMPTTKAVLYYEIIENSKDIVFYEYKPFKQNKDMKKDTTWVSFILVYVLYLIILLLLLWQVMFDQYVQ